MGLSIPQMRRMSRLLDEALPLDAAGRRAWLEALPAEHQDLAQALRDALLPGHAELAEIEKLETLPDLDAAIEPAAPPASGLQTGARVGPYQLIRLLGAGGMAEVWLARRADGAFRREVALKLPVLGRLRADLEQRFARERDILASLEHPYVARLYDAGVDPNGLPYLSMEYVEGCPLTEWCDKHRLGIRGRCKKAQPAGRRGRGGRPRHATGTPGSATAGRSGRHCAQSSRQGSCEALPERRGAGGGHALTGCIILLAT